MPIFPSPLTIANVFESRVIPEVYGGGLTEYILATQLGGTYESNVTPSLAGTYAIAFPDNSWIIGTINQAVLASGVYKTLDSGFKVPVPG